MNIILLIGVNLLIKPLFIFGIDRSIQNALPPEQYGHYFVLFNFVWLFQILNDFGIAYFNSRHISQYPYLLGKYFPHLLVLKGVLSLVFAVVVGVAAFFWGYNPLVNPLLWYIALNQALSAMVLFLRSNVAGLGLYRLDSLLSALDRLIVILICGALLWTPILRDPFQIEYFVWAQTVAFLITAGAALLAIRGEINFETWKPRMDFIALLLRSSFPYALAVFLMTVFTRVDAVMIDKLLPKGAEEASIYAAAYRLLDAANIIGFLFAGLLLPMFSRMLKQGVPVEGLALLAFRLLFLVAFPLAALCTFFGEEIMRMLYVHANAYYGEVLAWLMWSFIPVCGMYVYGTLLTAKGSLRKMNLIFTAGLVANIVLNALLIPRFQSVGAAIATCLTQLVVWLSEMVLVKKELGIIPDPKWLLRMAGFSATVLVLAWWMRSAEGWVWLLGLGGMPTAALLWRMLALQDIKSLWAAKAANKS